MFQSLNRAPKTYDVSLQHVIVRAEAADTSGVCAVLEMHHPANFGPPLHTHSREDEGFFILEGKYIFRIGDIEKTLVAGQFVMAARGVAHSFCSLGPEVGKMLVYLTPAGGELYFEEMSRFQLDDPERDVKCDALNLKYGITILGKGV
jgi:mannose-6-phosphate isomerase-like protein (cupin superfamily)